MMEWISVDDDLPKLMPFCKAASWTVFVWDTIAEAVCAFYDYQREQWRAVPLSLGDLNNVTHYMLPVPPKAKNDRQD